MWSKSFFVIASILSLFASAQTPGSRFEAQTIDASISIGYGLAIGDVDGDKKPDILLADKKQFVWYRNGDWKRFVMAENLTQYDNVCIAARDLDGDGQVEVAVGAQWNPGETADAALSGSVHYMIRPQDPTQVWTAVELHHEPTVHRMQWVKTRDGYSLVVAPLHGRGNKGGAGEGARLLGYRFPKNVREKWTIDTLENTMHLTHNFEVVENNVTTNLYLCGKEGIRMIDMNTGHIYLNVPTTGPQGVGEIRHGKTGEEKALLATIEPMHGTEVVVYTNGDRIILANDLKEGHALAVADVLKTGNLQVIAGWRNPDKDGKVGIKLFSPKDRQGKQWDWQWIDDNGMACEDLKVADLDGDGRLEIIAAGRATKNLKIYWNKQ